MATISVKLPNGEIQPMSYPDDWSDDQIKSAISKHFPDAGGQEESDGQSPMELELTKGQEKPERTGLLGVGSDLARGLGQALKGGIGFGRDLPKNLEKSGQYIEQHPGMALPHMAGQLAAETADIGKGIINAPYNLNQYLARKHLLPQVLGKLGKLIPHIPEDTGVEKALGLEADPEKGDALVRAIPDIAALAAPGVGAVKIGKKVFKAPDLRKALKDTQAKVNAMDKSYGSTLDKIEAQVEERGINKIPIDKSLINDAKAILDKSPETKKLISEAEKGNYKALRQLQADLRVIGENALSNKLSTERNVGKQAMSVRDRINKGVEEFFETSGNKDLAEDLSKTREGYRNMKDIYFSTPALAKAFGKSQRIPKNPATLLTEDSAEMAKFFEAHPEMKQITDKFLKHKGKMKALKWALGMLGTGATGGATYKALEH